MFHILVCQRKAQGTKVIIASYKRGKMSPIPLSSIQDTLSCHCYLEFKDDLSNSLSLAPLLSIGVMSIELTPMDRNLCL